MRATPGTARLAGLFHRFPPAPASAAVGSTSRSRGDRAGAARSGTAAERRPYILRRPSPRPAPPWSSRWRRPRRPCAATACSPIRSRRRRLLRAALPVVLDVDEESPHPGDGRRRYWPGAIHQPDRLGDCGRVRPARPHGRAAARAARSDQRGRRELRQPDGFSTTAGSQRFNRMTEIPYPPAIALCPAAVYFRTECNLRGQIAFCPQSAGRSGDVIKPPTTTKCRRPQNNPKCRQCAKGAPMG
jgi:hypothetical protein